MTRQEKVVRFVLAAVVIGLMLILALAAAVSTEGAAAGRSWVCRPGHQCHLLLEEGSEVYILTAYGRVRVEVFGGDVVMVGNVRD